MSKWKWEGIDKNGKKAQGQVDALDRKDVRKILRSKGIRVKTISAPSILEFDLGEWMQSRGLGGAPVTQKQMSQMTRRLAIMLNAGIPVLQCLEIIKNQETNLTLKNAISKISLDVGEGSTIAEAMKKHDIFDQLYCNLVRAGESAGILDTILDKLSIHMEKQERTRAQIKSAMMYPIVVVLVGIAVVIGMMVYVVPKFQDMIKSNGGEMPAITQFVIDISNFMQTNITLIMLSIVGFFVGVKFFAKTPQGKQVLDTISINIPIFGGIVLKGNLSSFTRTLSTMLTSGVTLTDALEICEKTIYNNVVRKDIETLRIAVIKGQTLTEPLMRITYFPDMVRQMVRIGEQTGALDTMLLKVADVFEEEVNTLVGGMTKMIEPIILVVLGGMVGTILIAMYMPIFQAAG